MVSSGLLRRVALVRTDVSEEPGASFIRGTKIGELGTTQAATSNRRTLRRNTLVFLEHLALLERDFHTLGDFSIIEVCHYLHFSIANSSIRKNNDNQLSTHFAVLKHCAS
jgi:hypothetical protein